MENTHSDDFGGAHRHRHHARRDELHGGVTGCMGCDKRRQGVTDKLCGMKSGIGID